MVLLKQEREVRFVLCHALPKCAGMRSLPWKPGNQQVFQVYAQKHLKGSKLAATPGNFTFQLLCRRTLDKDRQGLGDKPAQSSLTHRPSHSALGSLCLCLKQHECHVQQKISQA